MDLQQALNKVLRSGSLAQGEAEQVMQSIMQGKATDVQIAGLLVALRLRGETIDEIVGFARAMRDQATQVPVSSGIVLDTCGTGGDGAHTINISTLASLVAATAGARVAKHGNRSVSSKVGSADLLEALGLNLHCKPTDVARCIDHTGFGFLFAPNHHPAMKYAAAPRKELGVRTVFNILGPLSNPASASHQLLGVYEVSLTEKLAAVLRDLGSQAALVVHGDDGLDEISPTGPTTVVELAKGGIYKYKWTPEEFGCQRWSLEDLRGGDVDENVRLALEVMDGKPGALQDAVALNAGAALYLADLAGDMKQGVRQAKRLLESGKVRLKMQSIVDYSNSFGNS